MSGSRATWLVARREITEALRRRSFWVIAVVILAGSIAAMILPELLGADDERTFDVALVNPSPGLSEAMMELASQLDLELHLEDAPDLSGARTLVDTEEVDLAVRPGAAPRIVVRAGDRPELVAMAQQALRLEELADRLEAAGLAEGEVAEALTLPPAEVSELQADEADRQGAASLVGLVIYLLLLLPMVQVANSTGIEKANRISEVLLPVVRPTALLFGKVLGVGAVGLVVMACAALPVAVKLVAGGELPAGTSGALVGGAAWFLLGLALYLVAAGALGALVERQEEVGTAIMPLSIVVIGTYIVGQAAVDSPLGTVLAIAPFSSSLVMPSRLAMGEAGPGEVVASLVVGAAAVVVVLRVGAVVYRRAIVRTGTRLRLSEVLGRR